MENKLPKRSEVPVEMTWRLTDIYETEELWNEDYKTAGLLADEIREYEGRVCESADTMLKVFDLYEACLMKVPEVVPSFVMNARTLTYQVSPVAKYLASVANVPV